MKVWHVVASGTKKFRMDADFPLSISVFGFEILAVALGNLWHSENNDL
jgi:hypothetical protein